MTGLIEIWMERMEVGLPAKTDAEKQFRMEAEHEFGFD